MEIKEAIWDRRSIRRYKDKNINDDKSADDTEIIESKKESDKTDSKEETNEDWYRHNMSIYILKIANMKN